MEMLRVWLLQNGEEGRENLVASLKKYFPEFTKDILALYLQGKEIPDLEKAAIISIVTGIDLIDLDWKYEHRPSLYDKSENFQKENY